MAKMASELLVRAASNGNAKAPSKQSGNLPQVKIPADRLIIHNSWRSDQNPFWKYIDCLNGTQTVKYESAAHSKILEPGEWEEIHLVGKGYLMNIVSPSTGGVLDTEVIVDGECISSTITAEQDFRYLFGTTSDWHDWLHYYNKVFLSNPYALLGKTHLYFRYEEDIRVRFKSTVHSTSNYRDHFAITYARDRS